jgi:hypothetical protein
VPVASAAMQTSALAIPVKGTKKQTGCENKSNVPVWNFANRQCDPFHRLAAS